VGGCGGDDLFLFICYCFYLFTYVGSGIVDDLYLQIVSFTYFWLLSYSSTLCTVMLLLIFNE